MSESTVRQNLKTRPGYTPYCGAAEECSVGMPRTTFNGSQFVCWCGWQSAFEPEFVAEYVAAQRAMKQSATHTPDQHRGD